MSARIGNTSVMQMRVVEAGAQNTAAPECATCLSVRLVFLFSMRAVHEESNLEKCVFALESKHKCVADSFWGDTYHWHFWHQIAREQFHYISDKSQSKYSERFHISFPATPPPHPSHRHFLPTPFLGQTKEREIWAAVSVHLLWFTHLFQISIIPLSWYPSFFLKKERKTNQKYWIKSLSLFHYFVRHANAASSLIDTLLKQQHWSLCEWVAQITHSLHDSVI